MSAEAAPRTSRKRKTRWAIVAISVVVLAAVAVAVPLLINKGDNAAAAMQTATASRQDLTVTVSAEGSTEAVDTTEVNPEVSGTVDEVYVELGDVVKAGDDLFSIDDADLQKTVKTAKSAMNQSAQSVNQAEQSLSQAKLQKMQAEQNLDKLESRTGTLAPSSDDIAIAKQEISIAKQSVSSANEKLNIAEDDYADAADTYEDALADAKKTVVTAPSAGTVTALNVTEGSSVGGSGSSAGGGSSTGSTGNSSAVTIADTSELKVAVAVNEADISAVQKGQKANVSFDAVEGLEVSATVSWVSPSATDNNGVVTYDVHLKLEKQDERLRPGMSAVADVVTQSAEQALVVPKSAVKVDRTTKYVTLVGAGGSTSKSEVVTGLSTDDYVEITSGVSDGATVVVSSSSDTASDARGGMMFGGPMGGGPGGAQRVQSGGPRGGN